jgi:hypothetical protein
VLQKFISALRLVRRHNRGGGALFRAKAIRIVYQSKITLRRSAVAGINEIETVLKFTFHQSADF